MVKALLILNVALTIAARIAVGMLVDRYRPRLLCAAPLGLSGMLCLGFALAEDFQQAALLAAVAVYLYLEEPRGQMAEVLPDGRT